MGDRRAPHRRHSRRPGWLLAAGLLLAAGRPAGAQETPTIPLPPEPARNVILISWDGLDRSVLYELLAKQKLPHLAALIHAGSLQDITVVGHPTVTKPGHAEMLTGLDVKDTGVRSNNDYQPIPVGYSIFERVQAALGGPDQIHTFMLASKVAHVGGRGPDEITGGGASAKRAAAGPAATADVPEGADDPPAAATKGEPFYLTKRALDLFDAEQRDAAETGPLCLQYLAHYREPRFLAFLHFSDPDHRGHRYGAGSAEYRQAAIVCDEWLGQIMTWLTSAKLDGQTLVYVTTDHGFDMPAGKTHNRAPHAWLATNDRTVTRGGISADLPATILARFGVDLARLEPKLIGVPLSQPAPPRGELGAGAAAESRVPAGKGRQQGRGKKRDAPPVVP